MLKISYLSLGNPVCWFDCTFNGEELAYTLPSDPPMRLTLEAANPIILDVRFTNAHGVTTRDLDHAIPRWANASDWNKARAIITELREFGFIK